MDPRERRRPGRGPTPTDSSTTNRFRHGHGSSPGRSSPDVDALTWLTEVELHVLAAETLYRHWLAGRWPDDLDVVDALAVEVGAIDRNLSRAMAVLS